MIKLTVSRPVMAASLATAGGVAGAEDRRGSISPADFKSQPGTPFDKANISADGTDFPGRNIVVSWGYTPLFRGGHRVSSDELIYYKSKNTAEAQGTVTLVTCGGDVVQTDVLAHDIWNAHGRK